MNFYLQNVPLEEAKERFQSALRDAGLWGVLGQEIIPLDENAVGRILAVPIFAKISSPHYHAAAMDGFAIQAIDTNGAQPSLPKIIPIRTVKDTSTSPSACYVDTGDPLPEKYDSVIPIENVELLDHNNEITTITKGPTYIRIRAGVTPWSHVRPLGEDIVVTQLILSGRHALRPVDLGVIAAAGYNDIPVRRKPNVAIIPTGSELVNIGSELKPGDILEYNSLILAAQVNEWGGRARRLAITPDVKGAIKEAVKKAAKTSDLILLNAGSSAGVEDYSAEIIKELGFLVVHGIAIRPGHPVIFGMIKVGNREGSVKNIRERKDDINAKEYKWIPIIGVPGYPVSATLTGEIFIKPLISLWIGIESKSPPLVKARITRKVTSPPGDDDFLRVNMGIVEGHLIAFPLSRGAGVITSLVNADGIALIPRGIQGVDAGSLVDISLYRSIDEIEKTILCIGSHDITLDLLCQFLIKHNRRMISVNVGSQAGLIALQRGEAHLAGSHLLDVETGDYNITHIRKYLPGIPVNVIGFVQRQQGLIIKKGNPKKIKDLFDLLREDISYVNRQRGAGTRVLLDYLLVQNNLKASSIQGYENEVYTHLNVAAAVSSGRSDCGLGIASAAQALNLDFIPLAFEKYQLIIPSKYILTDHLAPIFEIFNNPEFNKVIQKYRGYETNEMGKLIAEIK